MEISNEEIMFVMKIRRLPSGVRELIYDLVEEVLRIRIRNQLTLDLGKVENSTTSDKDA
jgi:hypothetical protein